MRRWRITAHDTERIAHLERSAGLSPIIAQLLIARGIYQPETARDFLDAKFSGLRDPELLPGATEAADRLYSAIQAGKKIVVYGDYDADGMTGTAILLGCLKLLRGDVTYYVPNRLEEGYGLSITALESLAAKGAQLVISVDCGIASLTEAIRAKELGLELIVTDHHEFAATLPEAAVCVHPRLPGTAYPFGGLCGAGVALKVAWALCQKASQSKKVTDAMRQYLLSAMGLAAIGTVADVVPLVDENRILVRHGLAYLKSQPMMGLASLLEVTKLSAKPSLSSEDIAFTIAPRLNAAGRFGQAQLAVELLTTDSSTRAESLAEYIHQLNSSRESLERSIQLAAVKQAKEQFNAEDDPALVLAGRGWHAGVIGLVAGRLAEKFNRPVVLIALDQLGVKPGTGSARSVAGFNLHEALSASSEHLVGYGGHAAAAGLRIDETKVDAFREAFCEYAASQISPASRTAELRIDAESQLSQLNVATIRQIEQLEPFGCGNPRPLLCASGVTLAEPPKRIGGGERHISLKLSQLGITIRGVGFGMGDQCDELAANSGPLDIAYRPVINDFRGRQTAEVQLVDWRPSKSESKLPEAAAS